jgi:hypothetical protein
MLLPPFGRSGAGGLCDLGCAVCDHLGHHPVRLPPQTSARPCRAARRPKCRASSGQSCHRGTGICCFRAKRKTLVFDCNGCQPGRGRDGYCGERGRPVPCFNGKNDHYMGTSPRRDRRRDYDSGNPGRYRGGPKRRCGSNNRRNPSCIADLDSNVGRNCRNADRQFPWRHTATPGVAEQSNGKFIFHAGRCDIGLYDF